MAARTDADEKIIPGVMNNRFVLVLTHLVDSSNLTGRIA
jgi:hypothetical protein